MFTFTRDVLSLENQGLTDQEEIERAIKLGEYIKSGEWLANLFSHPSIEPQHDRNSCVIFFAQVQIPEKDVSQ